MKQNGTENNGVADGKIDRSFMYACLFTLFGIAMMCLGLFLAKSELAWNWLAHMEYERDVVELIGWVILLFMGIPFTLIGGYTVVGPFLHKNSPNEEEMRELEEFHPQIFMNYMSTERACPVCYRNSRFDAVQSDETPMLVYHVICEHCRYDVKLIRESRIAWAMVLTAGLSTAILINYFFSDGAYTLKQLLILLGSLILAVMNAFFTYWGVTYLFMRSRIMRGRIDMRVRKEFMRHRL